MIKITGKLIQNFLIIEALTIILKNLSSFFNRFPTIIIAIKIKIQTPKLVIKKGETSLKRKIYSF